MVSDQPSAYSVSTGSALLCLASLFNGRFQRGAVAEQQLLKATGLQRSLRSHDWVFVPPASGQTGKYARFHVKARVCYGIRREQQCMDGPDASRCPLHPAGHDLENFTVCSVRNESLRPQDASWAWREAWPLELLADTKASSRSVCLLAPTREVRVLDLPQVALWVGLIANLLSEEPI